MIRPLGRKCAEDHLAGLDVRRVQDPSSIAPLFGPHGPADDVYVSYPWFANFVATCLDPGDHVRFDVVGGGEGACLFPVRTRPDRFGVLRGRLLAGLSTVYSCRFAPVGLDSLDDEAALAVTQAWVRSLKTGDDRPSKLRFEALAEGSPALTALERALRRTGYWVERFPQFGNWHLPVAGLAMDRYWAGRPTALRNTVRRKERALRRAHQVDIAILEDHPEADRAITAYERVHAASWKPPEPYPAFMAGLIRTGLAAGMARVGLLFLDGSPAAAQVWVMANRKATIFKLSYDEQHKDRSVGSILTYHMMAHALDGGGLDEIDFGWGDDPYKRDWLPERRQRWGLVAYNPTSLCACAQAARNFGPRLARRLTGQQSAPAP